MFLRMPNSMALRRMLSDICGHRKSSMAVVKLEIHVSQLVDMIESKFQSKYHVLVNAKFNGT